jgi:hypothetical protein
MITGLLFTLAQKSSVVARDTTSEGGVSPPFHLALPAAQPPAKVSRNLGRVTQIVSAGLAIIGLVMLGLGALEWAFDPAAGLHIKTALPKFTLPVGVSS